LPEAQLVVFELAGNCYALDITNVHEILRVSEITPLPEMPAHMEGVINLRGKVVPVFNLRRRLGLPDVPKDQHTRIVLVSVADRLFGLFVDRVLEVNTYREDELEPPEAAGLDGRILRGIVKRPGTMWLVINLGSLA